MKSSYKIALISIIGVILMTLIAVINSNAETIKCENQADEFNADKKALNQTLKPIVSAKTLNIWT